MKLNFGLFIILFLKYTWEKSSEKISIWWTFFLLISFTFWGLHVCRWSDVYSTVHTGLISEVTEKIFKIGSMEPGAMLFEASKEFYVSYILYQ